MVKVIGICGKKGSGKSTLAEFLCNEMGYKQVSFASKLKDIVSILFGWDRNMLEGTTEESRAEREKVDERWSSKLGRTVTPRNVLQDIGCMFRNEYHPEFWIKIADMQGAAAVVISDVRFLNEAAMIRDIGGVIIHVKRDSNGVDDHASEMEMERIKPDFIIENNGTREDMFDHLVCIVSGNCREISK